jgi:hypothetical protein
MTDEHSFAQPLTESRLAEILDERDKRLRQHWREDVTRADQARWKRVGESFSRPDDVAERARATPLEFDSPREPVETLSAPIAERCDQGHAYWKPGPAPMPCPTCVRIGRENARLDVERLTAQLAASVERAQFVSRVLAEADRILYEWSPQLLLPPRPDLVTAREYVMTRIDEVLKDREHHGSELPSAKSWERG